MALIFSVNRSSVRATIEDCLFSENAALELGGGAYVLLDGLANHTVTINRTRQVNVYNNNYHYCSSLHCIEMLSVVIDLILIV